MDEAVARALNSKMNNHYENGRSMNLVYVVMENDRFDNASVVNIYSSEEAARAASVRYTDEWPGITFWVEGWDVKN